jgi:hypothetical protein
MIEMVLHCIATKARAAAAIECTLYTAIKTGAVQMAVCTDVTLYTLFRMHVCMYVRTESCVQSSMRCTLGEHCVIMHD